MTMIDLDKELAKFIRELDDFNERIVRKWDELQRAYEYADELWPMDDSTRRDFEGQWNELAGVLHHYRERQGYRYLEFLMLKKQALDRYFGR